MTKQIKFYDVKNEIAHGGILLDNGDILCACCGCIIPADKQNDTVKVLEIYKEWVDFSEFIVD